ncbi:response regulator [Pseudomonas rhizoryzae]|uniref:response regulator n=1 Tax=Pseudomonas rhizoryzae TaxID=2571129 RepID=UPI000735F8BB|nr:response regulator [Pseudomonas rhizoryzae]APQ12776.1 two-component system response regulator [Pseudomonas psychrotolerans]KTS98824.1 chemotaxis protein CheY [Pseudomonas psychrotolerans]KTT14015.1 chemotaxis protein CheY [Pseudomonas psychrotolerans]KTT30433.1 chemotaxis protein CheY [Pseudomonas psychrotolerans]KTT36851.1 chemotaxis protein CheY [Pseudomonas psychrotolerans]
MSKLNVLVVDDAPFIRDLIKKGLRNLFPGLTVDEAADGRRAQTLLGKQRFDLVLCDWEMPGMTGLELLSWFRSQPDHQGVPFIMVTSRGDKENVVQAIQAGVSDYMGKPFSNEQLAAKVKKALQRTGKLAELQANAQPRPATGFANDSLGALTGNRSDVVQPTPAAAPAPAAASSAALLTGSAPPPTTARGKSAANFGQGQLRLPEASMACLIKAISIKEALLVVRRGDPLPQVLETAVLDLEQGEAGSEVARLNGYLHSLTAVEPTPASEWLQVNFRFIDRDPAKLDYLSRLIAKGTAQRHYVPGA